MYAIKHLQAERGTWYWAVHFRRRGRLHYRRFYEPKYGGSAKALRAAIRWRDRELAKAKALTLHLKNLFANLNAGSRRQVVQRSRMLGLLQDEVAPNPL